MHTNFVCKICKSNFDNQIEYDVHRAACAAAVEDRIKQSRGPFECDGCGRLLKGYRALKKHKIKFHSEPDVIFCCVCAKLFDTGI